MSLLHYAPPTTPYLDILYQDDALVVFNKPSGLLTVPGKAAEHKDSLEYRARLVWPGVRVVHRLDMATSGIVLMALTADSQRELNRQFQQRRTQKHYIARVSGQVAADYGSIDLPLICDWPNRPKQKVCYQHGKASLTHYQVLSRDNHSSRLKLIPVTGRSHQCICNGWGIRSLAISFMLLQLRSTQPIVCNCMPNSCSFFTLSAAQYFTAQQFVRSNHKKVIFILTQGSFSWYIIAILCC